MKRAGIFSHRREYFNACVFRRGNSLTPGDEVVSGRNTIRNGTTSVKALCKSIIVLALLCCAGSSAFCQEGDFISQLKTQLLLYRTQKVNQTIVIQTDKTLYRPGETIWMKGYVSDAITHLLTLKSLEMTVIISDVKGANVLERKYVLKNGVVDYSFQIPFDLPINIYYLIAWTPEMETSGIHSVFRKEIIIGRPEHLDMVPHLEYSKPFFIPEQKETATIRLKDFSAKPIAGKRFDYQLIYEERELLSGKGKTGSNGAGEIVFLTPSPQNGSAMLISIDIPAGNDRLNVISQVPLESEKINVSFFPDGGQRVSGIPQMVVYEAKDQLGNPVDIKADIVNGQGKIVTATSTLFPGLGVLSLMNTEGEALTMRISSVIGRSQETPLPAPSRGGMSIAVKKNDGKTASLLLGRSPKSEPANFKIVAVANGELIWASDFELEQSGVLNMPLDNFNSEFAAVAVFNEAGFLVAQRLIFTGRKQRLNIAVSPDKSSYRKGEEGTIRVKVTGQDGQPVKSEMAVSLSDRFCFPESLSGIGALSYGLDKPLPFKEPPGKINRITLDYFLATAHLKGFDWKQVMAVDSIRTSSAKMVSMRVTGKVLNNKDVPVPDALVSLVNPTLQQFNARSDKHGEFVINLPFSVEKRNLSASATDGSGRGNYRVILNQSFKDELMNRIGNFSVSNWQILDQLSQSDYFRDNPDFFKPVLMSKVRSMDKKTREPIWKQYLNSTSNLMDILKTIRPYELMGGKIVFRGSNSLNYQDGAMIVLDGQKIGTDASLLSAINPRDVEDIRILLNPVDMARYTALNSVGIIEITTHRGGVVNETAEIVESQKENALKHFKAEAIGNPKYDLKTTLQWIPVLFTDENGEATIPFKAGGIKSSFILEIVGFTDQGEWIGSQTEIKVE